MREREQQMGKLEREANIKDGQLRPKNLSVTSSLHFVPQFANLKKLGSNEKMVSMTGGGSVESDAEKLAKPVHPDTKMALICRWH
eukprot:1158448-Pelagomonas_calceolata.AAC.5